MAATKKPPHDRVGAQKFRESAETLADNPTGDNILLGETGHALFVKAGTIGVVSLAVSFLLGAGDMKNFLHSYLTAFMFALQIVLGGVFWITLQHLVNAKWSTVLRRLGELVAVNATLMAVLSLPIVLPTIFGNASLYPWADADKMHADHLLHHKVPYLNVSFFAIRIVIYFGVWAAISSILFARSLRHDQTGDQSVLTSMRKMAPPAMILFALTTTFAAIDFLMTLQPTWFSTIFGVYYFAGCVIAVNSWLVIAVVWLQGKGRLVKSVTTEHFHDLGKMMFGFTIFWSYVAFSQFMLIWYANIPEETEWYKMRFEGGWKLLSLWLVIGNFVIPFFGLISRHVKRNRRALAFWAVYLLVCRYIDMYWLVKPNIAHGNISFHLLDITCLVAVVGILIASWAFQSKRVKLVPTRDPRLATSLAFENF
jgi:hypothetical protein